MADRFKHTTDIFVRFRDTDAMGHVNNAVYLSYLESARQKYWEALTGLKDFTKIDLILAHCAIDFRSPAKVGEDLIVRTRVSRLGRSSFDFTYRIEEKIGGRLVAAARTVQACFDYEKGKVKRMNPEIRKKIEAYEGTISQE